ncbi:unnamed protein product [Ilex paraguariensis]|uniref:FAS1 domain-containing protein n=1 Tax=Ilex paraguariensis TaxID=185542 RepID=A0ABC8S1W4_9AQUA
MASDNGHLSGNILTLFFTLLLISLPSAVNSIPVYEIDSMLSVLRARGYNLFCNAIAVSDVLYDVIDGSNFTFFAPTDSNLFALDMTNTASDYTTILRYHVVPQRLALDDLRGLPSVTVFDTMLKNRDILIERRRGPEYDVITVDGVAVVMPGLFYGRDVAVHGLGGILSLRSQIASRHLSPQMTPQPAPANFFVDNSSQSPAVDHRSASPSPEDFIGNLNFSLPPVGHIHAPPPAANFTGSQSFSSPVVSPVVSPVPETVSIHVISPAVSPGDASLSSANDSLPNISSDQTFASTIEPPVPAICQTDNPDVLWLSDCKTYEDHHGDPKLMQLRMTSLVGLVDKEEEEELRDKNPFPGAIPVVTPEVMVGVTDKTPDKSKPFDEKTFDCPVTNDETTLEHFIYPTTTCST